MSTSFPTAIDSFLNPIGSDALANATPGLQHHVQHDNINDAVSAVQAKIGIDGSAIATALDYLIKNPLSIDPGHMHTSYLKLDQTTPQVITNGIPVYEDGHVAFSLNHQLVDKEYVDSAVTSLGARYYMYDTADAPYKLCSLSPSADPEQTYTKEDLIDDDYLMGWISPIDGTPTKLIAGVYSWRIIAEKTAGTRTLRLYWTLVERKADTSEVVIATSISSNLITAKAQFAPYLVLSADYTPTVGSRIVGKIHADVGTSGNAPTCVLYYEGISDSHWQIPTNTEILTTIFVPYVGAGVITGTNFVSSVTPGIKPYACTSTTMNNNLNADLLDGSHAAAFAVAAHHHYELWESDDEAVAIQVDGGGSVGVKRTPITGYVLAVQGGIQAVDDAGTLFTITSYHASASSIIAIRRARGTEAVPTGVLAGDQFFAFGGKGWYADGADWPSSYSPLIVFRAEENFTASAQGTWMYFATTALGATSPTERIRITANGLIGLGKTPTTYKLEVNGEIQGTGYRSSDGTAGLGATKVFNDGAVVNTVTIKNGLITAWAQV